MTGTDKKATKCVAPEMGGKIALDIVFLGGQGKEVVLSSDARGHLGRCSFCTQHLGLWRKKAEATYQELQYRSTRKLVDTNDPRTIHERVDEGLALFEPFESDEREGLVVVVDPTNPNLLRSIRGKMSIGEFKHWSQNR